MAIATGQPLLASDINDLTFFPKGAILIFSSTAWSATSTEFKKIWKICDTANHQADQSIPDLTNKFLRGSSSSGDTGGADSCPVSIATANLPAHSHGVTSLPVSNLSTSGLSIASGGGHGHSGSGSTNAGGGGHKHSDISGSTGDPSKSLTGSFGQDDMCSNFYSPGGMLTSTAVNYDAVSDTRAGGFKVSINATHTHSFTGGSTGDNSGTHSHDVNVTIPESGSHAHTLSGSISGGSVSGSTDNAGSGTDLIIDTLPSYYTVIYIIKVV
ncbi:MAG: hypothetical protein LBL50_04910 [Candidatus Margulisbacteria bacterium]|jgi:hypothetical protein|nr:hypothetical protein [Candidatus Margulisiibacteriota bacterium]